MEIKFYANDNSLSCGNAYTSRGRLCDFIRSEYRPCHVKDEIANIKQYILVLVDDENVCDNEEDFTFHVIYGYRSFADYNYEKNWYLKKETAEAVYGTNENGEIVQAYLHLGHLVGKSTGEYPYSAYLRRNEKGLFCRLNIDPENEGHNGDGKLCFPDKSWTVTREGPYRVEVVRDMGNYAFIRGRCADFTFDELNLVLDHLWAKGVSLNTYIQKVSDSMFGTFYAYANNGCWEATMSQRNDCVRSKMYYHDDPDYRRKLEKNIGKLNAELDSRGKSNKPTRTELGIIFQKAVIDVEPDETPVYEKLNDVSEEQLEEMFEHVEWKKNLADLFIEGAYGDIHSKDELYALFTKSGYLCERVNGKTIGPRNGKKVKGYWFLDNADSAPDVVLDAFDAGILTGYSLEGIHAIAINENTVREVLKFSRDELDAIAEYVRKVNEQADTAIDAKLAHGKLRLE